MSGVTSSADGWVTHRTFGGSGTIFRIYGVSWVDEITVDVEGGYFEAGLSSSGNTYRVERIVSDWVVTGETREWIS